MAKTTPPLAAQERVILFCTATGVSHAAVGITAHSIARSAARPLSVSDIDRAGRREATLRADARGRDGGVRQEFGGGGRRVSLWRYSESGPAA
jgi:hypothetical protein